MACTGDYLLDHLVVGVVHWQTAQATQQDRWGLACKRIASVHAQKVLTAVHTPSEIQV
jgi:hypothetical protein